MKYIIDHSSVRNLKYTRNLDHFDEIVDAYIILLNIFIILIIILNLFNVVVFFFFLLLRLMQVVLFLTGLSNGHEHDYGNRDGNERRQPQKQFGRSVGQQRVVRQRIVQTDQRHQPFELGLRADRRGRRTRRCGHVINIQ